MKVVNMGFSLTILGISFYHWAKSEEGDDLAVPLMPAADASDSI